MNSNHKDVIERVLGAYFLPKDLENSIQASGLNVDPRLQFVSNDNSSSIISISYTNDGRSTLSKDIRDLISAFKAECSKGVELYSADITGLETMGNDMISSVEHDTEMMDMTALPLALIIFWLFLRNLRLLLIPMLSMVTSILYASSIMYPISIYLNIPSLAPPVMSSLCLAVSTDYTLFLLTRLNEERKTKNFDLSVANMLYHAGHVIIASGITLAITFAALIAYPTDFLQGFGISTSVSVLCSIFVNLNLGPTLLLCFPKFFSNSCFKCKYNCFNRQHSEDNDQESEIAPEIKEQRRSLWFKWIKFWDSPTRSVLLILTVFLITIPVVVFIKDLETTPDSNDLFASNSRSIQVMDRLKERFNPGLISPFKILTVPKVKEHNILKDDYFSLSRELFMQMNESNLINNAAFKSINCPKEIPESYQLSASSLSKLFDSKTSSEWCDGTANFICLMKYEILKPIYSFYASELLAGNSYSAIHEIFVDFDPLSEKSEPWIKKTRSIISNITQFYPDYDMYLYGGPVENIDMVDKITSLFPYMVIGTCATLFVIMGLVFRSIFIPLRGVLTIGLSVGWTFGIAVVIFDKILETKIFWFTPVFAFSIVVGLGLDYDIFLLSRIYEYRISGFTTRASIVKGSYMTGSIITGAGMIMIIAFLSLTITHVEMVFQFAVVLASAVFLDTFCIRTALVPAIMRLASWFNWWPSSLGSPSSEKQLGIYDEDHFLDDGISDSEDPEISSIFVKPKGISGHTDRLLRINKIISDGIPSYYTRLCTRK
jgi:uncharacterized membrane protein YdfJ with MMPL/SSD domain